jgi:hypothetical protein
MPSSAALASRPAQQAAPNPRRRSVTTCAPCLRATPADPSVDPLSTTTGWYPAGMADSKDGKAAASFRTGMTTSGMAVFY